MVDQSGRGICSIGGSHSVGLDHNQAELCKHSWPAYRLNLLLQSSGINGKVLQTRLDPHGGWIRSLCLAR